MNNRQIDEILCMLDPQVRNAKNLTLDFMCLKYPELDQEEVAELIQEYTNKIEF